jgi:hypothetical protein
MFEEEKKDKEENNERFEDLVGFFDLAFRVATRKGIDIGQFENKKDKKEDNA